ncbi:MAG: hypothetical protein U1G07_14000, partial [Verrucomicrobiota bacterium]
MFPVFSEVSKPAVAQTRPGIFMTVAVWTMVSWLALFDRPVPMRADVPRFTGQSGVEYKSQRDSRGPWSIHVLRISRQKSPFRLASVHADGLAVGLGTLSQQIRSIRTDLGSSIGAINGDFYRRDGAYAGDPRGLQIAEGELISSPAGTASLWIDAIGEPHITNTVSLFEVTWPNGQKSALGLNGARRSGGVELYTPAMGASTHTAAGRELVLEPSGKGPWLPLSAGKSYRARVREVREAGNTRLEVGTMVLSLGPGLARALPAPAPGTELLLSTETRPTLHGVRTAISGG